MADSYYLTDQHAPLDDLGFPSDLPGRYAGPKLQFQSEKKVSQRNADLMKAAGGRLGAGLNLLQSFRPGGNAAITSGLYGQQAQILAASRTQAPDLMFAWRGAQAHRARKAGKRAQAMGIVGGAIQALGTIGGALIGGPVGAAAGSAVGSAISGSLTGGGGGEGGAYGDPNAPAKATPTALGATLGAPPAEGGAPQPPPGIQDSGPYNSGFDIKGMKNALGLPSGVGQAEAPGGAPGGPQPAAGGGEAAGGAAAPGGAAVAGAAPASLLASGIVGPQAQVEQVAASVGTENTANMIGVLKASDTDDHYDNMLFFDGLEAGLDRMMVQMMSA